jgi:uncharacterized damage-inducible protein DinB
MHGYSAKDLARSFRTVRNNTIQIAEDIPEEHYGFRSAPETRSVAETLAHIVASTGPRRDFHSRPFDSVDASFFFTARQRSIDEAARLTTKAQLLEALRIRGEEFAAWLETLGDDLLSERVLIEPPPKTRFEMLIGAKEHEMHHRAQLMTMERMLGITPHLTRQMQERMARIQGAA